MREALRDQLALLWPDLRIAAEAGDGPAALLQIERLRPDFAFLDVRMPGLSGLQVARQLTTATRVVFVTAHDSHALEAFDANAVDYVLKPLDTERLARTVAKLRQQLPTPGLEARVTEALARLEAAATGTRPAEPADGGLEWLQVSVGHQIHMVHVDDVRYFESDTKYTRVVADGTDGLIRTSLKELLEKLVPGHFLQTHRSVLVNRRFIRAVHRKGEAMELELRGGAERLKVSLAHHHLFKAM